MRKISVVIVHIWPIRLTPPASPESIIPNLCLAASGSECVPSEWGRRPPDGDSRDGPQLESPLREPLPHSKPASKSNSPTQAFAVHYRSRLKFTVIVVNTS